MTHKGNIPKGTSTSKPYPLTSLQAGMLFHQIEGIPGVDIEQIVCKTSERIQESSFRKALGALVERHEVLRTRFDWASESPPCQEIVAKAAPVFRFFDSRNIPQDSIESDFMHRLSADRAEGIPLDKAPLIRAQIFRYSEHDTRILLTLHHAIVDGRSFPILLEDLFSIYQAIRDQKEVGAPIKTFSFREFANWSASQDFADRSRHFWQDLLAGFTAPTPLSVDHLPDVAPVPCARQEELALTALETESLQDLARQHGVTPNTIVQSAWAVLLSKYSGENDVVFGCTRACRKSSLPGVETAVGLFINTLPMRVAASPEKTPAQIFKEVRDQWGAMRDHEHTPLGLIQSWSDLEKGQPAFKSILVFENFDLGELMKSKAGWSEREVQLHEKTNFPLTVAAYLSRALRLKIEFDESEFSVATVRRILGHLRELILQFIEQPDQNIGSFHLTTQSERADWQKQWASPTTFPVTATLSQWFESQVEKTPDHIALSYGKKKWTYAELNRSANVVANHLITRRAISRGDIVGICVDRSPEIVIGILGILKSGAAYLPIDLAYPAERLQWMLEDAQAPVLLTKKNLLPDLPDTTAAVVLFEDLDFIATDPSNPSNLADPADLAYVIFTSGSTGKPKGCQVTHRNVARLMLATEHWYHFAATDVWTLFHSFAFDFSVWEIWGALLYGGRLVVVPHETTRNPEDFYRLLCEESVTVLNQTPSAFRQLIEAERNLLEKFEFRNSNLPLRFIIFGGEALELESLRPWFDRHGDETPRLINMYGITETTVHVTYRPISKNDLAGGSVIGRAIPDLEIYIFDEAKNLLPIGVAGEIYVGGAGVADGYLNRPELTALRFFPHPDKPGEKLYRTGDVAKFLPGGDLEYLGRCDDQVKIRGFRIELGEIQSVLTRHPAVREAYITVLDQKIIAYLVGNRDATSIKELRAFAGVSLPPYMIPAAFIFIGLFPLTNNGKIDRKALPKPDTSNPSNPSDEPPCGETETLLAGIWTQVLKLKTVGRNENYFELGGDSILSIQIVSLARKAGLALKPRHLFDHQTVAELAAAAEARPNLSQGEALAVARNSAPLIPIQKWFFEHDLPNPHHWNQAFLFNCSESLDVDRLRQALEQLVAHHPALRTRYTNHNQEILSTGHIFFTACDTLDILPTCDTAHQQLNISEGKLLSAVYFTKCQKLFIAIHHLAVDGVSWRILLEDVEMLYRRRTPEAATSLYTDWAHHVSDLAETQPILSQAEFWKTQARDCTLLSRRLYPVQSETVQGTIVKEADTFLLKFSTDETTHILNQLTKETAVRVDELLIAALFAALAETTGETDIAIDLEGHGREEKDGFDLTRTVGWFTTIYPVAFTVTQASSLSRLAAGIRDHLRALPDKGFGYGLLDLESPRREVLFNYLGRFDQVTAGRELFSFAAEDSGSWYDPASSRSHLLEINAWVKNEILELKFTYANIDHLYIELLAESIRKHLTQPLAKSEDALPLTPLQQLYFTLETARPGSGIDQWHWRLGGELDEKALHRAWEWVINQHEGLRTSFEGSGRTSPVQIVHDQCQIPFQIVTLTDGETFESILKQDRALGLSIDQAPLMRLTLVRDGSINHLIWNHHHLQIDGSSWPVLFAQISAAYEAICKHAPLPQITGKSIRDYLTWEENYDFSASRQYWKETLAGFRTPTPLSDSRSAAASFSDAFASLDRATTASLTALCRKIACPLNAVIQAAWVLMLSRRSGLEDIVFGASFSGRPVDIDNVESIIGTFVNNLPIRVKLKKSDTFAAIAKSLQLATVEASEHQQFPLREIQIESEIPFRYRLFDSLIVFQNYLIDETAMRWGNLTVRDFHAPVRTNYPLTLVVEPGEELCFNLVFQNGVFAPQLIEQFLSEFTGLLKTAATLAATQVGVALESIKLPALKINPDQEIPRSTDRHPPVTRLQRRIVKVWEKAFGIENIGIDENFFDLGGHSLLLVQVHAELLRALEKTLSVVDVFSNPTVRKLAAAIDGQSEEKVAQPQPRRTAIHDIAIIGMSCRFPGAENVAEFWQNLLNQVESIADFDDDELRRQGIDPVAMRAAGHYVQRRGQLPNPDEFDAEFFDISPREAAATDPQQRLFLECAWSALEDAGYVPATCPGAIGVFAGMSNNSYYELHVKPDQALCSQLGDLIVMMGNEKDYLTTRTAYKLNLNGPALNIYTACSTSLVAVAEAVFSLREGRCDLAVAGAVSITFPQSRGYYYQEGGITSADGHCRPFDANSGGTVFSNGLGVVILKPLELAMNDGDQIHAVIRGVGLNNDGADKVSFTAPSVDGQAGAIRVAHRDSGIDPATITYVEGHGTATALGDPIEVEALTSAFRSQTGKVGFCGLGSVKSNIGHLDAAAGMAGLIKTTLALREGKIPATLHATTPNPKLQIETSPFRIIQTNEEWLQVDGCPRRAGVSSFGVGGTNAHLVLEEAPPRKKNAPSVGRRELILLSAKSTPALRQMRLELAAFLEMAPDTSLPDLAFTLTVGRETFSHRISYVVTSVAELIPLLRDENLPETTSSLRHLPVAFLFPGQGAQFSGMGKNLYDAEPVFRQFVDHCSKILLPVIGEDIREIIFSSDQSEKLQETRFTQPALFVISGALAALWKSYGVSPGQMIGHSVGEYSAAYLAGAISLEDALLLIATRAKLVNDLPAGAMLSIRLPEAEVLPLLLDGVEIAALNSPKMTVVSGSFAAIEVMEKKLTNNKIPHRRLRTSHAFHSGMMVPVIAPFQEIVAKVNFRSAAIPYISNVTGDWITDKEISSPEYWSGHVRQTVRFEEGIQTLGSEAIAVLLEVGPGRNGVTFAKQSLENGNDFPVVTSLPKDEDNGSLLIQLGALWAAGAEINWKTYFADSPRWRISLPTYPFQRKGHWPNPGETIVPCTTAHCTLYDEAASLPIPEAQTLSTPIQAATSKSRRDLLVEALCSQFRDFTGNNQLATNRSFLDLGLDSLLIGQAAVTLSRFFKTKITFRHLMDEFDSIDTLARHLDETLPASAFSPQVQPASVAPVEMAAPSGSLEARVARMEAMLGQIQSCNLSPAVAKPAGFEAGKLHSSSEAPLTFGPFRRVVETGNQTLTKPQQAHLDRLIADYNKLTPKSKAHVQEHRSFLADPRAAAGFNPLWKEMAYPVVTEGSEGAYLHDIDGNRWIDVTHGFGLGLFGHRPKFVTEAIARQLDKGFEIGPSCPLAGEVAKMLCEIAGKDRATFCNTGSEAVTAAIRISRTVSQRDKIAVFQGSYHGIFDEVLGRPLVKNGQLVTAPIAPGIVDDALDNVLILEYGNLESLEFIQRYAGELAAVLVEPVQSRRPDLQPREFLKKLRALTTLHDIALVFDEVVTGFRSHPRGAQGVFGIDADLVTYGKVLGGGMPLGALAGAAKYMDALDGGSWQYGDSSGPQTSVTFFAGTFVRHPLTLAAARAVLFEIQKGGGKLQSELDQRTAAMVDRMNAFAEKAGVPARVTRFSSMYYINFAPGLKFSSLFFYHMRLRSIHIWETRPSFLSLVHTAEDIEAIYTAFCESITALQKGYFFPSGTDLLPNTPAQEEVLLASAISEENSKAFNESISMIFEGPLVRDLLRRSLQKLVGRHEALRTVFARESAGQSIKEVDSPQLMVDSILAVTDCRNMAEPAISRLRDEFLTTIFDLENGPLIRFNLLQLSPRRHELIISSHHSVCDGWSFGVIYTEIVNLYRMESGENGIVLPAPTPFREFLAKKQEASDLPFWIEQLTPLPHGLKLPAERKGAKNACRSQSLELPIAGSLNEAIHQFCRKKRLTPYTLLFAAYRDVLARISGQSDFCIGTPVASQAQSGLPALCGHGVHFLPIRCRTAPDVTLDDYLFQNRNLILDSLDHQNATYGEILNALPGGMRLDPVLTTFTLESVSPEFAFGDLSVSLKVNPKRFSIFDLSLFATDDQGQLSLSANFRESKFTEAQVRSWLQLMLNWLQAVLACDGQSLLRNLPLTKTAQVGEFAPVPDVVSRFEKQVAASPDAIALKSSQIKYSYSEVNRLANSLAAQLNHSGVKPGDFVALTVDRSPELIIAMIAILKCGAAYVPIDPNQPHERIQQFLAETAPRLVLDETKLADCLAKVECLELSVERVLDSQLTTINSQLTPESLAYVMFTSGSTGKPKGVMIPHRGITRLACSPDYMSIDSGDVFLLSAPISFDASTLEIWGPLLNGACLAIPAAGTLTINEIADNIKIHDVTILWLTAGLFHLMIEEQPAALKGLKNLLAGGDVLNPAATDAALRLLPGTRLINGYGPTENTTFTTCHHVTTADLQRPSIPIGCPISGSGIVILDEALRPVPDGVAGELATYGQGLALGYLNDTDLTAARFIKVEINGKSLRLYRTGDLCRKLSDGLIEFIGRFDNQVKIRGFRIEPAELENAFTAQPGVEQCKVIVTENAGGEKSLIAFCCGDPKISQAVESKIRSSLPRQLHPAEVHFMDSFPLNLNGKIDTAKLLDDRPSSTGFHTRDSAPLATRPPQTRTEKRLHHLWAELLGKSDFGIDETFFHLGGHSLLGLRLFNRLQTEFHFIKPLALLFEHPTVSQLAAVIDENRPETCWKQPLRNEKAQNIAVLKSGGEGTPLFLIHAGNGGIMFYTNLVTALGEIDFPIYALESPALMEPALRIPGFGDLVENYLEMIKSIQAHGPYRIGGYSFGGVAAFALAERFTEEGSPVDLVLFDSANPATEKVTLNSWSERAGVIWQQNSAKPLVQRAWSVVARFFMGVTRKTHQIYQLQRCRRLWEQGNLADTDDRLFFLNELHGDAIIDYEPQGEVPRALLIKAQVLPDLRSFPDDYGWGPTVGTLDMILVPGSHTELFLPKALEQISPVLKKRFLPVGSHTKARRE